MIIAKFLKKIMAALFGGTFLTGCLTVDIYQPMLALQHPFSIQIKSKNFDNTAIEMSCTSFDKNNDELQVISGDLCSKIEVLFSNQGARVLTPEDKLDAAALAKYSSILHVVVDTQSVELNQNEWMAALFITTLTLFPMKRELFVKIGIEIRDDVNFVLAHDTFAARFVTYNGAGYYALNYLMNFKNLIRSPENEISFEQVQRDFSKDFYGHLSQTVFNAKVRGQMIHANTLDFGKKTSVTRER